MSLDQRVPPDFVGMEGLLRDLLLRVGRGDEQAFARIYDLTAARVFGALRSRIGDDVECAAAMVRGYRMVWIAAPRFDGERHDAVRWTVELALLGAVPPRAS